MRYSSWRGGDLREDPAATANFPFLSHLSPPLQGHQGRWEIENRLKMGVEGCSPAPTGSIGAARC